LIIAISNTRDWNNWGLDKRKTISQFIFYLYGLHALQIILTHN